MAKKKPALRDPQLKIAGALGVAFVNTAAARPSNRQLGVESYAELLTWGEAAGVTPADVVEPLRQRAGEHPEEADVAFRKAATVRSSLAQIFLAHEHQAPVPASDLEVVNTALAEALAAGQLTPTSKAGLKWGWKHEGKELDCILQPVLRSTMQLLLDLGGRPHIRRCPGRDCALFFVDRSPSAQRKWCAMNTCGRRANSLRFYRRRTRAERQSW